LKLRSPLTLLLPLPLRPLVLLRLLLLALPLRLLLLRLPPRPPKRRSNSIFFAKASLPAGFFFAPY
jgi:hypothetical protein